MRNRKSTKGFPTSYTCSTYVTPKSSQMVDQKSDFLFSSVELPFVQLQKRFQKLSLHSCNYSIYGHFN